MGQKVNPTSLRLHPQNKHFDSCWFSEKQYAHSIHKDLKVEIYYNQVLKQIQYPSASFFFEGAPRKFKISVLFLNPAQLRKQAFKQFVSPTSKNRRAGQNTLFSPRNTTRSLSFFNKKKSEKESSFLTLVPPSLLTCNFLPKSGDGFFYHGPTKTSFSNTIPVGYQERGKEKNSTHTLQEKKWNVKRSLQSKKGVCSSLLALSISRYFLERRGGQNVLSANSRFLLLQAFFSFYKIKRGTFCETKSTPHSHFLRHLEGEKRKDHSSLNRLLPIKQKTQPLRVHQANAKPSGYTVPNEKRADPLNTLFDNKTPKKSSSYAYHIESIISQRLKNSCRTFFFKAHNVTQSALFLAEEIVYQLERRNSFRQIQTKLLQELGNRAPIKGVRVTCVGRIGGRAKKAQRARGESFKMGQTSLHLFDSKVSFASKTGLTPFGAVGVKVWICWK